MLGILDGRLVSLLGAPAALIAASASTSVSLADEAPNASSRPGPSATADLAMADSATADPATPLPAARADRTAPLAQFAAGSPGTRATVHDLSAALALVREFGVDSAFAVSDTALAGLLADDAIATGVDRIGGGALRALLGRYADALGDVVALRAGFDHLPEARVHAREGVAFVRPGTGAVELPEDSELVVLDLRDLPANDALDAILAAAVAPALASDVTRPSRLVRTHDGPADEVYSETSVYSTTLSYRDEPAIAGTGARDIPLVLLLGTRVSPQVASFAAALRAAGRAWISGADVPIEIAESTWQGVGDQGLMVRTSELTTLTTLTQIASSGEVAQGEFYLENLEVTPETTWRISLTGAEADDLDLYLIRDDDADGNLDDAVAVVSSTRPGSAEHLDVIGATLPPSFYQVLVHGNGVALDTAPFRLERESVHVTRLPDVIPSDLPERFEQVGDARALRDRLRGATPPPLSGPAERSRPVPVNPYGALPPFAEGRGELRASLLITHGVLRLFYPYLDMVGDALDARLIETLQATDSYSGSDRDAALQIVRRFGEALQDGHVFTTPLSAEGTFPVYLEYIGARPVVRRSLVADIHPGDTIVELDGRPIEEVYAEEMSRTSAATEAHRRDLAEQYIYAMSSPRTLVIEDTFGVQRSVTVEPQPVDALIAVGAPVETDRASGALADLGAPDLYYFNMNGANTPTLDVALQALEDANALGARGMVLDMRGYPDVNHYDIAARLIQQPFNSPQFEIHGYVGPGEPTLQVSQSSLDPIGSPAFAGPIVLVTGPHAVSAAENFMQMLVGAGRVLAVVGRRSAGTNGNITGLILPGRFIFTYTGMEVRNPDGSPFFGIGIVPDREVPITAEDLRDGIDRPLLEALSILRDTVPAAAPVGPPLVAPAP
jgi:C-terminal processing protease CtpA/Prc